MQVCLGDTIVVAVGCDGIGALELLGHGLSERSHVPLASEQRARCVVPAPLDHCAGLVRVVEAERELLRKSSTVSV